MKLAMYEKNNGDIVAGLVIGDRIVEVQKIAPELPDNVLDIIREGSDAIRKLRESAPEIGELPLSEVKLHAPIARPGKLLVVGGNYHSHIEEIKRIPQLAHLAENTNQAWFNKQTTAVTGPNAEVILPECSSKVDFEVELALVIGRTCRNVGPEQALDYVAGYMVTNDVSPRDMFGVLPECLSKSFDGFAPCGPWIVTGDELPDPQSLRLQTSVNGRLMQDGSTSDMVHSCAELISYLSTYTTLEPGDVLSTGTPAGVGGLANPPLFLQHGDVVRCEIEGIGAIETVFVSGP